MRQQTAAADPQSESRVPSPLRSLQPHCTQTPAKKTSVTLTLDLLDTGYWNDGEVLEMKMPSD